MKKLLIVILGLCFLSGVKAFAVEDCTIKTGCAAIEACITSLTKEMITAQRTLCGGPSDTTKSYYSGGSCTSDTPVISSFSGDNYWGYFQGTCDSDLIYQKSKIDSQNAALVAGAVIGGTGITAATTAIHAGQIANAINDSGHGPCLWLDSGAAKYRFIWSKDGLGTPPTKDTCASIKCMKTDDIDGVVHRDGYNATVKKARIESWEGVRVGERNYNDPRKNECKLFCSRYWVTLLSIQAYESNLLASKDIKDQLCASVPSCTDGDSECDCNTNLKGYWDGAVSKCICSDKKGTADFDSCVCTKKTPAGVWSNGRCLSKGSVPTPEFSNNNGSSSDDNTNTNSSSSNGTNQTAGTSGDSSFSSGMNSAGKESGGDAASASSGKSWLSQLKDTLGISSTSGGQKFGGSKGSVQLSGLNNGGSKKNTPTQGIASSSSDLFAMVASTYDQYETRGAFLGFDSDNNTGKGSSKVGTKPIIYK